jgi:hypothetical protein
VAQPHCLRARPARPYQPVLALDLSYLLTAYSSGPACRSCSVRRCLSCTNACPDSRCHPGGSPPTVPSSPA